MTKWTLAVGGDPVPNVPRGADQEERILTFKRLAIGAGATALVFGGLASLARAANPATQITGSVGANN